MANEDGNPDILGKKIFFLYPSVVVQNEITAELIQQEYEVYIVKDHAALGRALRRYSDSIVFAGIDERMSEKEWEAWIRQLMTAPETKTTAVGIISANDDETMRRKFINSVGVQCGYTVLKADLNIAIREIQEILKSADAKGRRKFLRAIIETETTARVNLPLNGVFINGAIKDISTAGFSCSFDEDPELVKNTLFKDIQLKLQSALLKAEGIVFGSRMDGPVKTYVFLFTQRVDPEEKVKIRKYIQQNLQSKMDGELKQA